MTLGTILLIVLIIILVGGVGPWSPRGVGYGFGAPVIGVLGVLLIILAILEITGRL